MSRLNAKDLTGRRFGRWVALEPTEERKERNVMWRCRCDCGTTRLVRSCTLIGGASRSCGCSQFGKRRHVTHGHSSNYTVTPEYRTWTEMKRRCNDPSRKDYDRYGGRGIRVCEEWQNNFAAFFEYMGRKPSSEHSIDRYPDNDGDYRPGNVRWATAIEQANNKSRR